MPLTLTIDTGNAAFDDDTRGPELARILRGLADRLENAGACYDGAELHLRDLNGNAVGTATLSHLDTDDEDDDDDGDDLCPTCWDPRCDGCTPGDTPALDDSFHRHELDT